MTTPALLISIIIPVYNVEKYIATCIESVLSQSFQDFELILIDDGSKDHSGKICDEYAATDGRIRVFHQSNQGASASRNQGVVYARGEWICFIDSDDYISRFYLEGFVQAGHLDKYCMNLQGWECINENEQAEKVITFPSVFAENEEMGALISKYELFNNNAPWGKLFNREVILEHKICFPPHLPVREDALFTYTYRKYIKSIQCIPGSGYFYRLPGKRITLSHKNYRPEIYLSIQEELIPLISKVFERFDLQDSPYHQKVISYFKNHTSLSLIKSLYAYPIVSGKRKEMLQNLFQDKTYFHDPAFCIKPLLRFFKGLFHLFPTPVFDIFCFIPFHFYYKYVRRIKS